MHTQTETVLISPKSPKPRKKLTVNFIFKAFLLTLLFVIITLPLVILAFNRPNPHHTPTNPEPQPPTKGPFIPGNQNAQTYWDNYITNTYNNEQAINLKLKNLSGPLNITQNLPNLTSLNLFKNNLTSFTAAASSFPKLTYLNLNNNNLTSFTAGTNSLQNLEELRLTGNKFTDAPDIVFSLPNLKTLDLSQSKLNSFDAGKNSFPKLTYLDLWSNNLTSFTAAANSLQNLQNLSLIGNNFTNVPDIVFSLPNLKTLWLNNNNLTSFTAAANSLQNLESLLLSNNNLGFVEEKPQPKDDEEPKPAPVKGLLDLHNLQNLEELDLTENPHLKRIWLNKKYKNNIPDGFFGFRKNKTAEWIFEDPNPKFSSSFTGQLTSNF